MFTVDRIVPVNDKNDLDHPTLSRSQVWRGLIMKAENALPFVAAMSHCEVLDRRENQLVREIVIRGERMKERVTFYPEQMVKFERLSGSVMGTILNEILEDERGELRLRFSFTLEVRGLAPGSPAENEFARTMEKDYLSAVEATVRAIRRMVTEGALAA